MTLEIQVQIQAKTTIAGLHRLKNGVSTLSY